MSAGRDSSPKAFTMRLTSRSDQSTAPLFHQPSRSHRKAQGCEKTEPTKTTRAGARRSPSTLCTADNLDAFGYDILRIGVSKA